MVTRRTLPWFGLCLTLGACGGIADLRERPGSAPNQLPTGGDGTSAPPGEPDPTVYRGKGTGSGAMSSVGGATNSETGAAGTPPVGGASGGSAPNQYPGQGFVVHEWGTDTVVVGSDG